MVKIFEILCEFYRYDLEVLSTGWVCWTIIPAIAYAAFMVMKWMILFIPAYVPVIVIKSIMFSKNDTIDNAKDHIQKVKIRGSKSECLSTIAAVLHNYDVRFQTVDGQIVIYNKSWHISTSDVNDEVYKLNNK